MKKSRAQFQYKIGQWNGFNLLMIADKDAGAMSVTNDIENVIEDIAARENIDPKEYTIVYRDSEGNWDGWDATTEQFFFFRRSPAYPAIEKAMLSLEF